MDIMNYIKPELIIVAIVLYFLGVWLKQASCFEDKYIPLMLEGVGIVICGVWVLSDNYWKRCSCGCFCGNNAGDFNSRTEYICQSDHKTIGKGVLV